MRSVLVPVAVAVAIGTIFIGVYLSAFHAPTARGLPVAVVSSDRAATVAARLSRQSPDTFRVQAVPDRETARTAVARGEVYAAYVPGHATAELLFAGAHGPGVKTLVVRAFGAAAHAGGERLTAVDVVPASPRDANGLVVFYTTFGLVLAGYLFGIMTFQFGPGLTTGRRLLSLAAFGGAGGLTVAAVVAAFDVLPAPFFGVAGLVALVAMAVGASTMLLVRTLGALGSSAAAVVFMTVGNATSGGSLPPDFLPVWLKPFSAVLPVGVGVRAVNGLAYFHGDGIISGIAVLTAWTGFGIGGLILRQRVSRRA